MAGFQQEADKIIVKEQMMFKQTILEVEGLLAAAMTAERNLQTIESLRRIPRSMRTKTTISEASWLFMRIHPHLVRLAEDVHKIEASIGEIITGVVRKNPIVKDHMLEKVKLISEHLEIIKRLSKRILTLKVTNSDVLILDVKEEILDATVQVDLRMFLRGEPTQFVVGMLLNVYADFHSRLAAIHVLLHVENYEWVQQRQNLANSYLDKNKKNYAVALKLGLDKVLKPWKVKVIDLSNEVRKKANEDTALFVHSLQNMGEANKFIEINSPFLQDVPEIPVVVAKIAFEVLLEGSSAAKRNCGVSATFNSSWNKFEFQFRGASFASPDGLGREPEEAIKELMKDISQRIEKVGLETWMNDGFNNGNVLQFRAA